jgi:hypothetical protein
MNRFLGAFFTCLVLGAMPASASPITYTFEGTNTGELGGVGYSDADFTITVLADSSAPSLAVSTSFTIAGVGSGTIAGAFLFVNHGSCTANQEYLAVDSCVGFSGGGSDFLDIASNAFDAYVLGDPIGPITDLTSFGNVGQPLATSAGTWIIRQYGDASFTAAAQSVPEPTTLLLTSAGIAAVGLRRRRRLS